MPKLGNNVKVTQSGPTSPIPGHVGGSSEPWVKASHGHLGDLRLFTSVPTGLASSQAWVTEVDSFIHGQMPPVKPPQYFGLYYDIEELAGVCIYQNEGGGEWFIKALAVSSARQREGFGRCILDSALSEMDWRSAEQGGKDFSVWCKIHESNTASRELFGSRGFVVRGPADDPAYEEWIFDMPVTPLGQEHEYFW